MHNQGTADQAGASTQPPKPQLTAMLQDMRAGVADAESRIDRLMVMRRRELAGLPPLSAREPELEAGA